MCVCVWVCVGVCEDDDECVWVCVRMMMKVCV